MKKSKATLAFEMLEAEMEVISREHQVNFIGGSSGDPTYFGGTLNEA